MMRPKVGQPCLSVDYTQGTSEGPLPRDAFLGWGTKEWTWAPLPSIHSFIHMYTQQQFIEHLLWISALLGVRIQQQIRLLSHEV